MKVPSRVVHLLIPSLHVSTALAYQQVRRYSEPDCSYLTAWQEGGYALCNDLQEMAFLVNPLLRDFYHQLPQDACISMTGSGAAFFSLHPIEGSFPTPFIYRNRYEWYPFSSHP